MPSKEDKAFYSSLIRLLNNHSLAETVTRAIKLSVHMKALGSDEDTCEPGAILSDALIVSIRDQYYRLVEPQSVIDQTYHHTNPRSQQIVPVDPISEDDIPFDSEED